VKLFRTCWAVALLTFPAVAQSQGGAIQSSKSPSAEVQPSPIALQLARALALPRLGFFLKRTTAAEMKEQVKRQLLSTQLATRGQGCDPMISECQAAADAIAAEHAAKYARAVNDAIDRGQAVLFEATMSPAQIRATLDFVKTDAGQAFAATFRTNANSDRALLTRFMTETKLPPAPFDEFYDATKHLPRAAIRLAPPPPAPPPPAHRNR
jgi:hypothetical protein